MENNEEEKNDYGSVTVGRGSSVQREIKIVSYLRAQYKDHRLVSCCLLEDDSYVLLVENPSSTGRSDKQTMRLSKESASALISTFMMYNAMKGIDSQEMVKESANGTQIGIDYSNDLNQELLKSSPTNP